MSGLSPQERADLAGVGFLGGVAGVCLTQPRPFIIRNQHQSGAGTSDAVRSPDGQAGILPNDKEGLKWAHRSQKQTSPVSWSR